MNTLEGSLTRSFEARIDDVSTPRRTVTAKINTNCVDRYNTVIVPRGGNWSNFMRSGPAVLWEHGNDPNRGRLPVAHCSSLKYRKADDDILGVMQFKGDDFSGQLLDHYASGTLRSFSVEFLPDTAQAGRPTSDEVRANPTWGQAHTIYRSWELTGFSAVSYPGNPEALAVAVERGLWVPEETRKVLLDGRSTSREACASPPTIELATVQEMIRAEISRAMAEGGGQPGGYSTKVKQKNGEKPGDEPDDEEPDDDEDDDEDELDRYISHEDGQYVVHAEDGKVLGKHKTKADAVKQLQAIEISKHKKSEPLPMISTFTIDELNNRITEAILPLAQQLIITCRDRNSRDLSDFARGRI